MIKFREANEKDYNAICHLVENEDELFLVYPSAQYPLTIAQLKKTAETRNELTVAENNTSIIGFANLYNYQTGIKAFIGNVIIKRSERGQGTGKAMVTYMLNKAFTLHQLPEVHISVFSENTPALLLYTGLGFHPYQIEKRTNPQAKKVALIHMKMTQHQYQTSQF